MRSREGAIHTAKCYKTEQIAKKAVSLYQDIITERKVISESNKYHRTYTRKKPRNAFALLLGTGSEDIHH